jgi:putative ATP-dependent endonuclease of the OLD family
MRLQSITIRNYRSLRWTGRLPIDDFTVLVGPNNEGKSNILRALAISLQVLSVGQRWRARTPRTRLLTGGRVSEYDWSTDFPSDLQGTTPNGKSHFELDFLLDAKDSTAFRRATGSRLNTPLRVVIEIGPDQLPTFDVRIQGPAKERLKSKRAEIARFSGAALDFSYIPSLRPAEWSTDIASEMIEKELEVLKENPEFKKAQDELRKLERPILDRVGEGVRRTLATFLPEVKRVSVEFDDGPPRLASPTRRTRVVVDDGHVTDLEQKGDGMKSLAAVALMHHTSESRAGSKGLVLAIEEPEAHLHPDAVHRLKPVLAEISKHSQVVITTHSPILVNRVKIDSNVVVKGDNAKRATALRDIRDALGVRISDNLAAADLVLLVEGEEDVKLVTSFINSASTALEQCLSTGRLAFDSMGGASNLTYSAQRYKRLVCDIHAFLDDDEPGRDAYTRALTVKAVEPSEIHLSTCPGREQSELEDLLLLDSYKEQVQEIIGVNLDVTDFRSGKAKWSDRVRAQLKAQGKPHSEGDVARVKLVAHEACGGVGVAGLSPHHRGSFDSLVAALERRLGATTT